ncbi:SCP2 domain-containing protein [Azovibrio restrictus]|uniref:ubiquinone anaerobic biosynthesis accessory factor UbiT n=1 Tax=Azovibrio restrictus TaxID=146938 RepID=UPI0026EF4054|nr:SCP2 sterol-binding domain-containing protein [Azovibrio restrictus]
MTFTLPALPMHLARLPAVPDFQLPGLLKALNRRLPQWPHAVSLCLGLNAAARLGVLPEEAQALCEGRAILVAVEDGGTEALFTCRNGLFQPLWQKTPADVCFRGELHAYLKLLTRQEDPDTLFFNRQLSIEGDTELGLAIKNLLDAIDWPPPVLASLLARLPRQERA